MDVGSVANVLELHAAAIFRVRVKVCRLSECASNIILVQQTHGGKGGGRFPVWGNRVSGQRNVIKTLAANGFLVPSMALKRATFVTFLCPLNPLAWTGD